jgi:hypothetical protein
MLSDEFIEELIHAIRSVSEEWASAKARKTWLEEQKKVVLARQMIFAAQNGSRSSASQERDAYASPEYSDLLVSIRHACNEEARLGRSIKEAEMRFEAWRTQSANEREERSRYKA